MIITLSQLRGLGLCSWGIKRYCDENNIDFLALAENGIEAEKLDNLGDARISQLIKGLTNGS